MVLFLNIEYVDNEEEETTMISMTINDLVQVRRSEEAYSTTYTHCEIHPSLILGICAFVIPFHDHNQSPHTTYQSAIKSRPWELPVSNGYISICALLSTEPLVTTRAMEHLHFRQLPAGIPRRFSDYESILNRRWVFISLFFQSYRNDEKKMGTLVKEDFGRPNRKNTMGMRHGSYDKLDDDGLAPPVKMSSSGRLLLLPRMNPKGRVHAIQGVITAKV